MFHNFIRIFDNHSWLIPALSLIIASGILTKVAEFLRNLFKNLTTKKEQNITIDENKDNKKDRLIRQGLGATIGYCIAGPVGGLIGGILGHYNDKKLQN